MQYFTDRTEQGISKIVAVLHGLFPVLRRPGVTAARVERRIG